MFRRYPYWGWLGISLVLWVINFLHFHAHRQEMLPEKMTHQVSKDLDRREDAFNDLMKDKDLLHRIFSDSLTNKEVQHINALPFYIYAYVGDSLRFWNNNSVIGTYNDTVAGKNSIKQTEKGVFIRKCIPLRIDGENRRLVILYPVLITYPLENDYLHSHFVASEYIPLKTKIAPRPIKGIDEYPIFIHGGNPVGYLVFNPTDIQKWAPDNLLIVMLLMAILTSIAWLQLMAIHLTRKRSSVAAFVIIIGIIAILRTALYVYGLPFSLDTLTIFSPRLYASSQYLSSLGDLFINILFVLWVVVFVTRHTGYKTYFTRVSNASARVVIAIVLMFLLTAFVFLFIKIVSSLVLDSNISFDVTHFYAINIYTVFGLLAIVSITGITCMIIYLFNVQFAVLLRDKWLKYLSLAVTCVLYVILLQLYPIAFSWYVIAALLIFVTLLDIPGFSLASKLFEPHMILWAIIICGLCTGLIRYFNQVKEGFSRRAFVEQHLTPHRDDIIEFSFDKTAKKIEHDSQLKNFLYKPSPAARKTFDQHFETQFLTGALNKYQVRAYLFDNKQRPLFNKDTTDYNTLLNEKSESVVTNSAYLFYKESILDRHYYLSFIPIYNDTVNTVIGYVVIDLDLKKTASETVYPELLQPLANKTAAGDNEYAYAVYIGDKLITQTNDYPFLVRLKYDTLREQQYVYATRGDATELYYKIADKRTVVVVHYHSEQIETITLFSYLFGIQILVTVLIFLYQLYLSYFSGRLFKDKFIRLTLRRRVHFSMLTVVFVSFSIIGFVTIQFFSSEYRKSNEGKLQTALQVAKQSVQDYLARENAFNTDYIFDTVSKSQGFKSFISGLANKQKIDINIFDDEGTLFATSQDEIYDKGLISRKMRPDAYYELNTVGQSLVIQSERVAGLSYNSAYQPLRDDHGVTLGYINVPFFSSEKDLDFRISNILVTLINLYAFIFLVSGFLTFIVTRWMTRTFDIIIRQFDKLNLEQNERISWPYEDEIGKLVSEYNKMVKKVEENAARLAQSERESAWREMARQVAHEIKNPLTPMKLNIQYLQQAVRNNHPNVKDLTDRVSDSIIEQIDNLSYIASEFSNFAKMPEAKPEEIELGELLNRAVELYTKEDHVEVTTIQYPEKLNLLSDKSQLLRVFTNLLENANQAIPEGRMGNITVKLERKDNDVIISIADNGSGIPADVEKRIFQPYFTTKSSGTGLGLAMTKKIIEFWKGEIWFETQEDVGTTFFIRLPLL